MNMRDDLAQLLVKRAGDHIQMLDSGPEDNNHSVSIGLSMNWAAIADIILAAGWRPPARIIDTDEELDGLRYRTVVMDRHGFIHQKFANNWQEIGDFDPIAGSLSTVCDLPVTVIWEPGDDDE